MKPNRDSILLDMDGVIVDQLSPIFDFVYDTRGIHITHSDVHDYWFKGLPVEPELFLGIMRQPGYYRSLEANTGALAGIRRLRQTFNNNIFIVTAPLKGADTCKYEKESWVSEFIGSDFLDNLIVTHDKADVPGKVILEDNPDVEGPWDIAMYHQRWNRKRNTFRMYGWQDLDRFIANFFGEEHNYG